MYLYLKKNHHKRILINVRKLFPSNFKEIFSSDYENHKDKCFDQTNKQTNEQTNKQAMLHLRLALFRDRLT